MAIYALSYLGTDNNKLYFNDYNQEYNSGGSVFRIKSRAPQQRSIRELDIPIPFENGISDFETLIGKTVYVLDGTMYPGGESDSDSGLSALRKVASLELNQSDILSDNGYIPYVWTEFSRNKQVFMKPLYVQIVENTRTGLVQNFRIISKIKDPTIYEEDLQIASTEAANFTTATGTAILPHIFPLIFGASTSSVSSDAINNGDLPSYPVAINIYGPVSSPKITNSATGEYIEVAVNLATSSNNLSIAYDKDTLRVELDGVSVINQVTAASDYWKLQPGSNIITLTGSSISNGAYAAVSYYSAWPLS